MISQSLVSALDDGVGGISSQDIVAPILFLLCLFFILSIIISCTYVTRFQVICFAFIINSQLIHCIIDGLRRNIAVN